jgi:hypothetical protein
MPSVPPPSVPVRPVYVPTGPIIYQPPHRHCSCYANEKVDAPWPVIAFLLLIIGLVGLIMLDVFWTLGRERWSDFQEWRARKRREKEWKQKNPNRELPKYPWDIR